MPGYARCPKCRKPLPRRAQTQMSGGTAVEEKRRWPLYVGLGVVVLGVIVIIKMGGKSDQKPTAAPVQQPTTQVGPQQPTNVDTSQPFNDQPITTQQPSGPDPAALASALERDLKRQRLWANVTVDGTKVEVRSGSCSEPAMAPALDGAAAGFKAAGLTKLRCVEQSGRVVTDRDL